MKQIIDNLGKQVEVAINTPTKMIDGVRYLLTPSEIEEHQVKAKEYILGENSRKAKSELIRLETQITTRRLREALLGTDNGWLVNQEALIKIERAKL